MNECKLCEGDGWVYDRSDREEGSSKEHCPCNYGNSEIKKDKEGVGNDS